MANKIIIGIAVVILAVCLISGGCSFTENNNNIKAWKDLLKLGEKESDNNAGSSGLSGNSAAFKETIDIDLYFAGPNGTGLAVEKRTINKTEGIARSTIEELIKGPEIPVYSAVFPEGTRLIDINIKPNGLCIVNFSSEVRHTDNAYQEEILIYAVANTLGQFPTVKGVSFMVDGEMVDTLGGYVDVSSPVRPDYTL